MSGLGALTDQLLEASHTGDKDKVAMLLSRGAPVNGKHKVSGSCPVT